MKVNNIIEDGIKLIYPNSTLDESLKKMVISEIKRKLLSFELLSSQYEQKYKLAFEDFFDLMIKDKTPSYDIEDDYFSWEMSITAINELKPELSKIENNI